MGPKKCRQSLNTCGREVGDWLYDIFTIVRKNLRVRRRRFVALLLEMCAPVLIVALLVGANSHKPLLRIETLEFTTFQDEVDKNDTLEGFYDLGSHFDEVHILKFALCAQPSDPDNCRIAYVADPATKKAIFDDKARLKLFFPKAEFIEYLDEQELHDALEKGTDYRLNEEDAILGFRGAIIFQTSVNDPEVKYKIRLMEKYYGSLRHVLKTSRLYPSIYDRREYAVSYLDTGFLTVQFIMDRMIIEHIKAQSPSAAAQQIVFNDTSTHCTCEINMHEIPHRQSDQFHDADDPLEISDDYDENHEPVEEDDTGFLKQDVQDTARFNQVHKQSLVVSTILVLSFTFLLPSEQRRISSEKENGLTILLLVTGMTYRMQWIGNLFSLAISYIPTITVVVILLTVSFNKHRGAVFEFASASVLWVLLFLYVMALAAAGYCTTVFFDKPIIAIAASVTFWVSTFITPMYHIDYFYDIVPIWITLIFCLHPCIALQMALRLLIRFERHEVKTTLFNMSRFIPTDPLRIVFIIVILIFDTIIYMMLAIYLDRVLKSKYGVNKPWYYIFSPSEYKATTGKVAPTKMVSKSKPGQEQPGFEPCPEDAEPSIITTNLTKRYGKVVALEYLNVQLYHGEIFALLGHNGAGKSTTLNLFSGFTAPTFGTAKICGYDIKSHMVQIQAFTGMCPQYNSVYDDLTPHEHLIIFGRLRGLRGADAVEESMELLEKLRIHEMAHWAVRKLSKGDKRKLSLAIALIGNPKVLILDEPTAGLDYYSRRAVWDILLKIRSNHTIIFSTHYMDEAELLGDRIGILASGKMEVCGSHAFLRRHFGLGYSLKIKMNPKLKPDIKEILDVVRGSMPNATLNTLPISPNVGSHCAFNLPVEGYSSATMSTLFTDLARVKESLGIVGFSVSYATIDEIFLELTRQLNPNKDEEIPIENDEEYNQEGSEENIKNMFTQKKKQFLFLVQYFILVRKRMLHTWRNKDILIFQLIIPCIVYGIGILRLSSHVDLSGRAGPPLEFRIDAYEDPITLYHASDDTFINKKTYEAVIGPSAKYTSSSDLSGDYIHTDYHELRNRHIVGISAETGSKAQMFVHFSPYVMHSSPLALNLYANTLVKYMAPSRRITVTNHPLPHPYFVGANYEEDPYAPDVFAMTLTLSGTLTVSCAVIFPLDERLTGVKHLQLMSGVSAGIYWFAIFTWDLILLTIEGIILTSFGLIHAESRALTLTGGKDNVTVGRIIYFYVFVYSGLMLAYTVSHFARSKSGAFALLVSIILLFGVILPFFTFGIAYPKTAFHELLLWTLIVIPAYALSSSQRKYSLTLLGNARCNHFTEAGEDKYCREPETKDSYERKVSCCKNCPEIRGVDAHKLECYDRREMTRLPWQPFYHNYGEFVDQIGVHHHEEESLTETRNIFYEVLSLLIVGIFFHFVTVLLDSDSWTYISSCVSGERGKAFQTNVEDEDIVDEMDRVERMVDKKKTDKEALVAHNLCKSYGTYPAVHNLSFIVHPGESFGIIGVNGAGKSTLFSLLTGTTSQTYGNIYSVDCNLNSKRAQLMRKMGYAPHHGLAVVDFFTCAENVVLFGRLRGLSSKEANDTSVTLLKKMGLHHFANTRVNHLSGGTKRRLGTALAVVADPPVILFDEPTSAADPASRRQCWEVIKEVKKAGHTLILSSHQIHECEDLCHRMIILVDGKFQCIGSPSHLREKFGSGYKLIVKLIPGPAESQGYVSSLSESIVKTFNPCTLRDRRRNVVQYVIHDADFAWDFLFQMMEHIKLRYNDLVEDYAFSNTTMEEVFLSFVVLQNCGRILDQSPGACFGTNF